jgi:uncharacterized integral membrane protein
MSTTGVKPDTGPRKVAGVSVTSKRVMILVIVVAAIWFVLVNTQRVSIYLWVPKVTAPLWLVLVITFAGGLITGLLLQRRNRRGGRQTR